MRAAGSIAKSLTGKNATTAHGYVTIAKIGLSKLNAWSKNGIQDDVVFRSYVKEITEAIQGGLQHFPDDPYLRAAEAQLSDFIEQDAKAIESLRRAFLSNKASPFIAKSLARHYERNRDLIKALNVLEECLDALPRDKSVNAALAQLLTDHFLNEGVKAEMYWRRSFTEGDTNYSNQFWYARQLFINLERPEASARFELLKTMRVDPNVKHKSRGMLRNGDGSIQLFHGQVSTVDATYALISVDGESYSVYVSRTAIDDETWRVLAHGRRVNFNVGFNYYGLTAVRLQLDH